MSNERSSMSYDDSSEPKPDKSDAPIPFDDEPLDLIDEDDEEAGGAAVSGLGGGKGGAAKDDRRWNRSANTTGEGAVRMKMFYAKLRPEALDTLDDQINEWLDANPQYEVKFATTTTGDLLGKSKEPAIFVSVWV